MAAMDHEPTPKEIETIFDKDQMKIVGPPLKLE